MRSYSNAFQAQWRLRDKSGKQKKNSESGTKKKGKEKENIQRENIATKDPLIKGCNEC